MKVYMLMLKEEIELKGYLPKSCYINKDNALFIQNKMRKTYNINYELKEMSICDSALDISQDINPSKYKWGQA